MRRQVPRALLASVVVGLAALVLVATQLGDLDAILGVDRDTVRPWAQACTTAGPALVGVLFVVTAARMLTSARRQQTRTMAALRPLLASPGAVIAADLAELLARLRLERRVRVVALELPVALCYGLLRPRLLLSTGVLHSLSSAEIEAVLRHEQVHLRRHDPLRLVVVRALADALPVLPALRQMAQALPVTQELAADRVALAAVGADALGSALLKVGSTLEGVSDLPLAIGAFGALDARIDQLLGAPVPALGPSPWSLLPLGGVLVVSPLLCLLLPLPVALIGCAVLAAGPVTHARHADGPTWALPWAWRGRTWPWKPPIWR
jgi:Zn-dependent protease with chaperone function